MAADTWEQARSIESNWPLLIPPLLALLDDASTAYKIRGCSLLTTLLRTVPPQLLERTGLGEVFHEALTPCLLYLPALTPEAESLQLLNAVYPTLLALIRTRFPLAKDHGSKQEALDQILRYGILKGYAHAGENVRIAEFLVTRMTDLVTEMGIASCKYLKVCLYYGPQLRVGFQGMTSESFFDTSVGHSPFTLRYTPPSIRNRLPTTTDCRIARRRIRNDQ